MNFILPIKKLLFPFTFAQSYKFFKTFSRSWPNRILKYIDICNCERKSLLPIIHFHQAHISCSSLFNTITFLPLYTIAVYSRPSFSTFRSCSLILVFPTNLNTFLSCLAQSYFIRQDLTD